MQETPIKPAKPKYCCLCAQKGHEADKCTRANRPLGPLSVHVHNYTPVLRAPAKNDVKQKSIPKCTILASHISDYTFNFGNDVSYKGNSMYARFRRAVNLSSDPQNESGNNSDDVMFVGESNLHDTSEPPIEVYDDDFGYDEDFDNISSTEHFSSEGAQDSSFMTVDNVGAEEGNTSTGAQSMDSQSLDVTSEHAKIQELDEKMQTLSDLKAKMLGQPTSDRNDVGGDGDSPKGSMRQNSDISSTAPLADFIPLSSNEPDKYEPTRSPSPVSADSTTAINEHEHTDATIHLTPEHCKQLVAEKGTQFLRNRSEHFKVTARLEWRNFGNVLIVNGTPAGQKNFHNELKEFFKANEPVKPSYTSFVNLLPKNRSALIKYIRSHLLILDSAICNKLGDPVGLYHRICLNQMNPSKANMKQASKFRKQLNMILFGRYGFADGHTHLSALQDHLRAVISKQSVVNVSQQVRKQIADNIDYIFSDMDHGNYDRLLDQYNAMKRNKRLPPLRLKRVLLGLKINVLDAGAGNENPPGGQDYQSNINSNSLSSVGHRNRNGNNNGNQMNALPTSNDIQINVSKPSASHYNQGNQDNQHDSDRYRQQHHLDKWKY